MAQKWYTGKSIGEALLLLESTKVNAVANERKLIAGGGRLAIFLSMAHGLCVHLEEELTIINNFKDKKKYDELTKGLKKVHKMRNDLRKEMVEWKILEK